MSENLIKRGSTYWCRFYVVLDQQARLSRREFAWSLKTRDPKEARSRLAAARLRYEQLIVPPDPRRLALEEKFGIPANLPADEALARLQAVIAAGQAADDRRWTEERRQAGQVDPADFGMDVDRLEPAGPTEADRLEALFNHRAEDADFQAVAAAAGLVPERIAAAEAAAAQLVAEQPKPAAQAGVTWDALREAWELERKPARKTIIEASSSIDLFTSQVNKPVADLVIRDFTQFKTWLLAQPGRGGARFQPHQPRSG